MASSTTSALTLKLFSNQTTHFQNQVEMEITNEVILSKTHYGLTIYSYILQQYYPGETVLTLAGRECSHAKNPFNANKNTLLVKIVDDIHSTHIDLEEAIAPGNCFDFASLHFKLSGQELNQKLNEVLHLRIGQVTNFYSRAIEPITQGPVSIPIKFSPPTFSYFYKPITNTIPNKEVSLIDVYKLIKGESFSQPTISLRSIADPKEARKYKALNFDYVTFSGTFSKRNDNNLKKHSGLLTIDFDKIKDLADLKEKLVNDQYFETELLFQSPSGDGLKWIIPMDLTKAKHQNYFKAVSNYITKTYCLEVDQSGKDISRACFLPHDSDIYINPKYLISHE